MESRGIKGCIPFSLYITEDQASLSGLRLHPRFWLNCNEGPNRSVCELHLVINVTAFKVRIPLRFYRDNLYAAYHGVSNTEHAFMSTNTTET